MLQANFCILKRKFKIRRKQSYEIIHLRYMCMMHCWTSKWKFSFMFSSALFATVCIAVFSFFNLYGPLSLFSWFVMYFLIFFPSCKTALCKSVFLTLSRFSLCASSTAAATVRRARQASWSGCVSKWRRATKRRCFSCSFRPFTSSSATTTRSETQRRRTTLCLPSFQVSDFSL